MPELRLGISVQPRPADETMKKYTAWRALVFDTCAAKIPIVTGEPYCHIIGILCSMDHCPARVTEETTRQEEMSLDQLTNQERERQEEAKRNP